MTLMELDDVERDIIERRRAGTGVLLNCNFGYGIGVDEAPDGRANVYLVEHLLSPTYDGPAIRDWMRQIINSWTLQLADPPTGNRKLN